jgi:hypothetical protein
MFELQGDQQRLEDRQHDQRTAKDDRTPQNGMEPKRRPISQIYPKGKTDDDKAKDEDDEDGRAVTGVMRSKIEVAFTTPGCHLQIALKQTPPTTSWAAPTKPGSEWRDPPVVAAAHSVMLKTEALMHRDRSACTAHKIDAEEEENPHHIDKVPIPGCRFKAKMMVWGEMPFD